MRDFIMLEDGTRVEIEVDENQDRKERKQTGSGISPIKGATLQKIEPIIENVSHSVVSAWNTLNEKATVKKAEIEVGFSFESEGNIFIAKAKGSANLVVKLTIEPKI